jgi:hypothetical protein
VKKFFFIQPWHEANDKIIASERQVKGENFVMLELIKVPPEINSPDGIAQYFWDTIVT